jgi:hypothetical protein
MAKVARTWNRNDGSPRGGRVWATTGASNIQPLRRIQVWVRKWLNAIEAAEKKFFASKARTEEDFDEEWYEYECWLQRQMMYLDDGE